MMMFTTKWGLIDGYWFIGGTPDNQCEWMFSDVPGASVSWWREWWDGDLPAVVLYYTPKWTVVGSNTEAPEWEESYRRSLDEELYHRLYTEAES